MIAETDRNSSGERQLKVVDNKVQSDELFADSREVTIVHEGEAYKLRVTGNNRLILNK